jgi:hypothetical protein
MGFGFFKNYGKQKAKDAEQGIITLLVNFDPEGATEAQLATYSDNLTKVSEMAAKARQVMEKEKLEADNISNLYSQRMSAAELLQKNFESETDLEKKKSLEKSLTKLMENLEKMVPEVESEVSEAKEATEYFEYLEQLTVQAAEKLKGARGEFKDAMRKMTKAKLQEQMAKEKEEAVKVATGVTSDNFSTALGAMHNVALEAEARGEAAKKRTELLKPVHVEEDENVAEALKRVKGEANPPVSLSERLAKLKKV